MTPKRALPLFAAFAFGLLLLAACGGGSSATSTPTPSPTAAKSATVSPSASATKTPSVTARPTATGAPTATAAGNGLNPCDLVTVSQMGNIFGEQFNGTPDATNIECQYQSNSDTVYVELLAYGTPAEFDAYETTALGGTKVDGVGDAAYWVAHLNELDVRYGTQEVAISLTNNRTTDANEGLAKQVAQSLVIPTPTP